MNYRILTIRQGFAIVGALLACATTVAAEADAALEAARAKISERFEMIEPEGR